MTRWAALAGVSIAVLAALLVLARASQSAIGGGFVTREETRWLDRLPDGADHLDAREASTPSRMTSAGATPSADRELSTPALLANVAISHGFFAVVLLGAVWWSRAPLEALGVAPEPLSSGTLAIGIGLALGIALALANVVAGGVAKAFGADPSEELRELLAPESASGWALLLVVVLPVIAGFEELLFRAVLVGAFSVGFDLSPWLLAVLSSAAFAAGHGAQGGLGIVVTGLLGFALATAFILTNSLLAVVIAHYVVNAVEFVVGEGLEWEPFGEVG